MLISIGLHIFINDCYSGGVVRRMPVMEGAPTAPVKARSRATSLDAIPPQQNGAGAGRDSEEAVSEGEGVARAAAALVSVKVDVDETAKPLMFHGDGTSAQGNCTGCWCVETRANGHMTCVVKDEPVEATSSGGASDEDEDIRARQAGVKRRGGELSTTGAENLSKRARHELDESGLGDEEDERERVVRNFVESASAEGPEEAARCAEALRSELNMLRALAEAKEREWNQVRFFIENSGQVDFVV